MKKLFFPTKSYSWLQFPVSLDGYPGERHPHLTVKYFGPAVIDSYAIGPRVGENLHKRLDVRDFQWVTKFWSSPFDHKDYCVLAFSHYPNLLTVVHDQFDIIRDQYIPWTPHITVTKEYFMMVEEQGLTPKDCKLEFGEIELCLGGENI